MRIREEQNFGRQNQTVHSGRVIWGHQANDTDRLDHGDGLGQAWMG